MREALVDIYQKGTGVDEYGAHGWADAMDRQHGSYEADAIACVWRWPSAEAARKEPGPDHKARARDRCRAAAPHVKLHLGDCAALPDDGNVLLRSRVTGGAALRGRPRPAHDAR